MAHQSPLPSYPSIFGTDGVRDRAGEGFLAPRAVERLVAATALVLGRTGAFPADFPAAAGRAIALARDTRSSGEEILGLVARGFTRHGYEVLDLGVLPTPAVAAISASWPDVVLGVMVSASHNPAEYNGIKFLAPTGAKISPAFEAAVSEAYWTEAAPGGSRAGRVADRSREAFEAYVARLIGCCRLPERWRGRKVALDAANGAAYRVAPEVFGRLGAAVTTMGNSPDGSNINLRCGALEPQILQGLAESTGAIGFCFDGDGDRMIPVTERGALLSGDHVLLLAGKGYQLAQRLPLKTVVGTVMSNLGLELALAEEGLRLLRTDVGDRNVYLAMIQEGHPLGGEQSGHVIFLDTARTGDGILAALRLLDVLEGEAADLDREARAMTTFPQVLKNVPVAAKPPLESLAAVVEAVEAAKARLGDHGRILLRYSGTEPLARVMLEGPRQDIIEALAAGICAAIRSAIGAA